MNPIYCGGNNTENLPFNIFYKLFIEECNKEGTIIEVLQINKHLFAKVLPK